MAKKVGYYTYIMNSPPSVLEWASVASKKEAEGPLAGYFDIVNDDSTFGEKTWEKAESRIQKDALNKALAKAKMSPEELEVIFAGDLLNQCTGTTFGLREMGAPLLGLYSACSTISEAMLLSTLLVDSGAMSTVAAVTSSHFCSAERQFRFPLEYGGQRTPTSQWTATAGGAMIITNSKQPPFVRAVTPGRIADLGIKDANNMGAAMAPAAAQTLCSFFADTMTNGDNYDMILTGDLGYVGSGILYELMSKSGYDIASKHSDCGLLIYDRQTQDVHAGGSGAGCSSSVLCSYILPKIRDNSLSNVLFLATGALLSTTTVQQGESIPGISHLIHLSNTEH